MTAKQPVPISYWRWELPSPTASPPSTPRRPAMLGDASLPELRDLNQTELLNRDFYRQPGVHVIFMPKTANILDVKGSEDLCKKITKKFFLPEFFFRSLGWNANGMFGSTENLSQSDTERSYGTFSRFLFKHVKEKHPSTPSTPKETHGLNPISKLVPEYEYEWRYMAFCTIWRSSSYESTKITGQVKTQKPADETNLLLCFDLDDEVILRLRQILHSADLADWKEEPFLMLELALNIVLDQCEKDLWSFQKPVRQIEKTRGQDLFKETDSYNNDKTFGFLVERYSQLHELSRHVIHISETMDTAVINLAAIVRDYKQWAQSTVRPSAGAKRLLRALLFRENMISNLNFRAKAFVHRMNNEIKCASNFVAVADSNISKGILHQTRNDGKILSDTVSILTILFLPGTFISGFFGMNFFVLQTDNTTQKLHWEIHPKLWLFFVLTVPITILGLFNFILEFNFVVWIQSMQKLIYEFATLCKGKGADSENLSIRTQASSRRERSWNNFGFSRRATLRATP